MWTFTQLATKLSSKQAKRRHFMEITTLLLKV